MGCEKRDSRVEFEGGREPQPYNLQLTTYNFFTHQTDNRQLTTDNQ
jgi:hypothetical protein